MAAIQVPDIKDRAVVSGYAGRRACQVIGVLSIVRPARESGAIVEFKLGTKYAKDDKCEEVEASVN